MSEAMKIQPCPWCGEAECLAVVDVCRHEHGGECLFAVRCEPCGAQGPSAFKDSHIFAWNRVSAAVHGKEQPDAE